MDDFLSLRLKNGPPGAAFLQQDAELLTFNRDDAGRAQIGCAEIGPLARSGRIRDWSNQELADLYRVKALIEAAGIPCEADRGLTDEGDPWFVYCRADGEVIVHICRIDGRYILDSASSERPLSGFDFNELSRDFTGRLGAHDRGRADGSNVVRLHGNAKVYLHPSMVLAALIWTLFLDLDEIEIPTADGDDASAYGTGRGQDDIVNLPEQDNATAIDLALLDTLPDQPAGKVMATSHDSGGPYGSDAAALRNDKNGVSGGNLSLMVLQSVAAAMGFTSCSSKLETGETTDHDSFPGSVIPHGEGDTITLASGETLDRAISALESYLEDQTGFEFADIDGSATQRPMFDALDQRQIFDPSLGKMPSGTEAEIDILLTLRANHVDAPPQRSAENDLTRTDDPGAVDISGGQAEPPLQLDAVTTKQAEQQASDSSSLSLDGILTWLQTETATIGTASAVKLAADTDTKQISYSELDLDNGGLIFTLLEQTDLTGGADPISTTDADASATEAASETDETASAAPTASAEDRVPGQASEHPQAAANRLPEFDAAAHAFIDFQIQDGSFELVAYAKELIFIDTDAFSGNATALSWQLEDGGVISFIGLRADFEAFQLI